MESVWFNQWQQTSQHLFFSCPYSSRIWELLAKGILKDKFTNVWSDIVALISGSSLPPTEMFLIKYTFQVAVHGVWRERNRRRYREQMTDARVLSKLLVKTIRLHLSAVQGKGHAYLERGLRTWFGTRIDIDT
ncbi:hypothetical protein N665_0245s0075 [Sinapis alba]|nr:hypothetical protein N665_0245s0075 [Sinapis alba]